MFPVIHSIVSYDIIPIHYLSVLHASSIVHISFAVLLFLVLFTFHLEASHMIKSILSLGCYKDVKGQETFCFFSSLSLIGISGQVTQTKMGVEGNSKPVLKAMQMNSLNPKMRWKVVADGWLR